MHDRQPQRPREVDPLGAPVEHGLGTDVDPDPGDLVATQLAARLRRRLENQYVVGRVVGQEVRGSQAGDAGTDDDAEGAGHGLQCARPGNPTVPAFVTSP